MAKARLERLTLTKFRGCSQSTTFEFDANKEIILIFGENGTGKSSIADALDFLCNNEFGSLLHRKGTRPAKHIITYEAAAPELEVALRFGGQTWNARLRGQKPVTRPEQPPRAFVLRRADITKVMESQPADRYKALQVYITVPNIEHAEAELREAYKNAKKDEVRAVDALFQAKEGLEQYWRTEGAADGSAIEWAEAKTSETNSTLQNALEAAKHLLTCFDNTVSAYAQWQEAQASVRLAEDALADANRALHDAVATLTDQSDLLVSLLDNALNYLQFTSNQRSPCPVCGKPEDRDVLLQRVQSELEQLTQIRELAEMRDLRQEALAQTRGALARAERLVVEQCQDLAPRLSSATKTLAKKVDSRPLNAIGQETDSFAAIGHVLEQLTDNRPTLEQKIDEVQKTLHQRNAIRTFLQTFYANEQATLTKQGLCERLLALLQIVERERKAYIANLMAAIALEVNNLYTRIHPDELLGRPTFTVKAGVAGSLELKADFADAVDVVPGAYYSEAHLDTLGLCVYLALAKHSGAGDSLVVLDDVLTSVDEVHLERIIDLLNEEAPNFGHLIITTHSRTWFEHLRSGRRMNADLFELNGWDLQNGIRHSRTPPQVEELRQAVSAARFDR